MRALQLRDGIASSRTPQPYFATRLLVLPNAVLPNAVADQRPVWIEFDLVAPPSKGADFWSHVPPTHRPCCAPNGSVVLAGPAAELNACLMRATTKGFLWSALLQSTDPSFCEVKVQVVRYGGTDVYESRVARRLDDQTSPQVGWAGTWCAYT